MKITIDLGENITTQDAQEQINLLKKLGDRRRDNRCTFIESMLLNNVISTLEKLKKAIP